jgi:hypothetical protein
VSRTLLGALPGGEIAESILKGEATPVVPPAVGTSVGRLPDLTGTAFSISLSEESGPLSLVAQATARALSTKGASVQVRARSSRRFWDEWLAVADFDIALIEVDPAERSWCWVTAADACDVTGFSAPEAVGADPFAAATAASAALPLWDEAQEVLTRPGLLNVRWGTGHRGLSDHMAEWAWSAD